MDIQEKDILHRIMNGGITPELEKHQQKCTHLGYLKRSTKNNPASIAEMIEVYLEETPQLINTIRQAIHTKNWESVRITAHSIIPSFAIMGMDKKFGNIAKHIQENAGEKNAIVINELFQQIENICLQACEELKIDLASLGANEQLL